jgi:hypothetical protein
LSTEVWFRNPHDYIRELVECGESRVIWDRGMLVKKRIDPIKHAELYFGPAIPWRVMLCGEQGTAEYTRESPDRPVGVYPTWAYGEDAGLLEEIVTRPVGVDASICADMSVPVDERPVFMQEHRVVVIEIPPAQSGPGRKFLRYLKELQEDNPECKIHVHGLYGWRSAFGLGYAAADVEPRTLAQKGKVILPAGTEKKYEIVAANPQWVVALGFRPVDLAVPRNRCMYNIKSAVWAAEHYVELFKFKTRGGETPDSTSSDRNFVPATTAGGPISKTAKAKEGDQFHCDTCSLFDKCKYARVGAVCSVPGAEPTALARFFQTRDSDMIIDGLGVLLGTQTRRLERGLTEEEEWGEVSPEVTKMISQIFDQGVKLAKLVDPKLRGSGVNINVGAGGTAGIQISNPNQAIGAVVRELEARGVPRNEITPELIQGVLSQMAHKPEARQAIEGTVVSRSEEVEQSA